MKKSSLFFAAIAALLVFACNDKTTTTETPPAEPDKRLDFTIVPGERVGLITKDVSTQEAVLAAYGDSAKVDSVHLGEGIMDEGVVLFPDNPRRMVQIWWDKEFDPKRPGFIRIWGADSLGSEWKTDGGITIGTPISEIEKGNGQPFEISGFGWDYGGRVTNWNGGKLAGKGLGLVFDATAADAPNEVMGERNLMSNDSLVLKAQPKVFSFEMRLLAKGDIPACIAEKVKAIADKNGFVAIKKMNVAGQDHFWVNDGAAAYDGVEYVYDNNCKELCRVGGMRKPLECSKVYDAGKWEVVWEQE